MIGAGLGFLMGTTNLIAQNSVERHDLGVATSTATFAGASAVRSVSRCLVRSSPAGSRIR
ncbi:hypothetical protein [Kibdelosporangium philippinense]|uniref:hypothetical protein n=1 Tax=Kibdelosporangium philippinense TaxID=211113 RepID=UPI003615CCAA